jgi:N-acetylmuramoyl-L-alanine amidase CwlD
LQRSPEVTLSSMNRLRAQAGSALAFGLTLVLGALGVTNEPARAQAVGASGVISSPSDYWFGGTRLTFDRAQYRAGRLAVATDDSGLARFLGKLGATLAYQPGQKYVVITTGDRRAIAFALGDPRFEISGTTQTAGFAPFASGSAVYLPFADLARALYVVPILDGDATVLQPQIAALDVRQVGRVTTVTVRGASPLRFKRTSEDGDDRLTLTFTGISSTLEPTRDIPGGALNGVTISASGTPRNPTTAVSFEVAPNSNSALVPGESANALSIAFAPAGVALAGTPIPSTGAATVAAVPVAQPAEPTLANAAPTVAQEMPAAVVPASGPTPTALGLATATVSNVDADSEGDALDVDVAIAGPVTYEWHRLSDNRWYVDLKPATLGIAPQEIPVTSDAVESLRVKGFVGPTDHLPTVRVAMTLATPRIVNLTATSNGLTIAVDRLDDFAPLHAGLGELTGGKLVASIVPLPAAAPAAPADGAQPPPAASTWKFGAPPPAGTNPRLIVIDPGHGGSDDGAMHNGLVEKQLNLNVAERLKALLIARGWLVKMTRETDVDVFAPNDSAHDELQARCDVSNQAGARLFISIHTNSFTTSELSGTTTFYYKSDSYGLADAVHARLAASLPTADDGIRKENFYVIHHTTAPAILVEMAFLSNPGDAQLLKTDAFLQKIAVGIANGVGDYATPGQPVSSNGSSAAE